MKASIEIKYILLYSILTTMSIIIGLQFWWTDSYTLSLLSIEVFALMVTAWIYWMAVLYISVLAIRKYILKLQHKYFFGPLYLVSNESFHKKIGFKKTKKIKPYLSLTSFLIFISSIIVFNIIMNIHKHHEIDEHGEIETIMVKDIHIGGHGSNHIYFEYNHKDYNHLPNMKNLKIGDLTTIIYSTENPKLVEYYLE